MTFVVDAVDDTRTASGELYNLVTSQRRDTEARPGPAILP